jgi:hypothetical protein
MLRKTLRDLDPGFDLDIMSQREDKAASQGFIGGVFAGLVLGVVLTLIFTPRRGEQTRAAVASAGGVVKDKAVDLAHRAPFIHDGPAGATDESFDGEVAIEREIGAEPASGQNA